jgi:hypothetical protein
LEQLRLENDIRAQSFALREKELDTATRAREQALTESQEHLRALLRVLERDRAAHAARETRISDLEGQLENYRRQLTTIVSRAVANKRMRKAKKSSARLKHPKSSRGPTRQPIRRKNAKGRAPSAQQANRPALSRSTR